MNSKELKTLAYQVVESLQGHLGEDYCPELERLEQALWGDTNAVRSLMVRAIDYLKQFAPEDAKIYLQILEKIP